MITATTSGSSSSTHWYRIVEYAGRKVLIQSTEDCEHIGSLGVVCDDPKYGDDRVICHLCAGMERR